MSPTVHREGPYRFYFFSREEVRPHIHIESGNGEAKFWLEPIVAMASSTGMKPKELRAIQRLVESKRDALLKEWEKHFKKPRR